jgi:hypothetical protein
MKFDRDCGRTLRRSNGSKPFATHAQRSRGFDAMVSTMLLALLVAAIALENPISREIGGAGADRQSYSYFASAVNFVVNFCLSFGLTWLLFSSRPPGDDKGARP